MSNFRDLYRRAREEIRDIVNEIIAIKNVAMSISEALGVEREVASPPQPLVRQPTMQEEQVH